MLRRPTTGGAGVASELHALADQMRRVGGDDLDTLRRAVASLSASKRAIRPLLEDACRTYGDALVAHALDMTEQQLADLRAELASDSSADDPSARWGENRNDDGLLHLHR